MMPPLPGDGARPSRILLAEDDSAVRVFVARALSHAGHDVVAVADGAAALDALARDRFDLLLTDVAMPSLDGVELALRASQSHPDMAILMMSGYAAERQRAHGVKELAHGVLPKPFSLNDVCAAVAVALRRHGGKGASQPH